MSAQKIQNRSEARGSSCALFVVVALHLFISSAGVLAQSPMPAPSSANELFKDRAFGPNPPPTPTPRARPINPDDEKPIPVGWYIGGAAAALLALAGILYGTARASHSSNLFDRQYQFPVGSEPALRFGGTRCGGHMATVDLGRPRLKSKDT